MQHKLLSDYFKLLFFSIFTAFVSYGFTLSNFSLSVDNETPVGSDFSLRLGRWGTNLIRYHIFEGHLPYFTLLLSLMLLALTAVELSKLLKFEGVSSYVFCTLFLSFPQLAYQLVFTMQADVIALGFLLSVYTIILFQKSIENLFSIKSILLFIAAALVFMFVMASYQGLILIPIIIYLILFFQNTYSEKFEIKKEFIKLFYFGMFLGLSVLLYIISVKLFCPPMENGYFGSYTSGESDNQFLNGCSIWFKNLIGGFYYGERLFILATILSIFLFVRFFMEKKLVFIRVFTLLFLLFVPFLMSFFIYNGYHPPRLYLTSGIVFAFIIVQASSYLKKEKEIGLLTGFICLANIYFISQLFYSNWKISNHDKEVARKIDLSITNKYPEFDENLDFVYFYGCLASEQYEKFKLKDSEIFGGSLFIWDNGENYRINNLFRYNDIAYYRMIDNKEIFLSIKDSINDMPTWPNKESIKKINNVVIVKLGKDKGSPLWVE